MSEIVQQSMTTIPTTNGAAAAPAVEPEPPAQPAQPGDGAGTSTADSAATPPPAESEKKQIELAQRFETLSKQEAKARRRDAEFQTKMASLTEREKALEEKLAELDAALEDPVGWHLKKGKDPVEVAKRFAKPMTEEEKRIKNLEDRLEKQAAEEKRREEEWQARQKEQTKHQAMRGFVSSITAEECPNVVNLYQPHEVPKLVDEMLNRPSDPQDPQSPSLLDAFKAKHSRNPSDKEIRDCLEYEAGVRATRILEWHRQQNTAAVTPSESATDPAQPGAQASGPSSISNQHAAHTSSAGKSRKKTRDEIRKELTAQLEAEAAARESQ